MKEKQSYAQSFRHNFAQTKMLLVISSVFLCFNLPAYVLRIHAFLHKKNNSSRSVELTQQVCNLLFNTNFGINFIHRHAIVFTEPWEEFHELNVE
ncbi:hypothetical protein WN51_03808 [Melipona quadrifasciata]|uniref:Uncharacterized protein n=1 Tax=Melipona quadrifasciata TaxID=166423 RepID=A0A0N0U496_9HYME|nr:hypothetical protein WN51_03808 [Melipona quadrifasciata]